MYAKDWELQALDCTKLYALDENGGGVEGSGGGGHIDPPGEEIEGLGNLGSGIGREDGSKLGLLLNAEG